jgi:glutamate racemase
MRDGPIGIFDSGFGGLSILKAIKRVLPFEDIIYFGDNLNAPYGDKKPSEIKEYTRQAKDFLFKKGAKVFVVACNSACAYLPKSFLKDEDVFEIIIPSVEKLLKEAISSKLGILATKATLLSKIYERKILKMGKNFKIFSIACPFAYMVENGVKDSELIKKYVSVLKEKRVKTVLLACTHFIFIKREIQKILGKSVKVVDPSLACANALSKFLEEKNLKKRKKSKPKYLFYTSGDCEKFKRIGSYLLKEDIKKVYSTD